MFGHYARQGGIHRIAQLTPGALIHRGDRIHLRKEISLEQEARNLAKVDPQVADSGAVRHGEVGGDAYEKLVQGESLRPKGDQLARRETGETVHLTDRGNAGEDILGPKDRRQVQQFPGDLRLNARVPWSVHRRAVGGIHAPPGVFAFTFRMLEIIPIPPAPGGTS